MRVAIHQPEFSPWLGFFHKTSLVDTLIYLDDVQYRKNYFLNRNRIRIVDGWTWVTVPVNIRGLNERIDSVRISSQFNHRWLKKMEATLSQAYSRASYFDEKFVEFVKFFKCGAELLIDLNIPLLDWMIKEFGFSPKTYRSSSFQTESSGSEKILELCQFVGADTYLSGVSGRDYLDVKAFESAGISVEFQEFFHPVYEQLYPGFFPQMSALESLFLLGNSACDILRPSWSNCLDKTFL